MIRRVSHSPSTRSSRMGRSGPSRGRRRTISWPSRPITVDSISICLAQRLPKFPRARDSSPRSLGRRTGSRSPSSGSASPSRPRRRSIWCSSRSSDQRRPSSPRSPRARPRSGSLDGVRTVGGCSTGNRRSPRLRWRWMEFLFERSTSPLRGTRSLSRPWWPNPARWPGKRTARRSG